MARSNYRVTERVFRDHGRISQLFYEYTEDQEQTEHNLLTQKRDIVLDRRLYLAVIKREDYERMVENHTPKKKLTFDQFIDVLRPFMMGTYQGDELTIAFDLLDRDKSGTIDVDEIVDFLPIISSTATKQKLLYFIGKADRNDDQKLDLDEFRDMILRGIAREIITGHI